MKKMKFTIGSDPELMVRDNATGKIISALPVLVDDKGVLCDKYNPIDLKNGVFMYADNILAETKFPPVSTKKEFIGVYRTAFSRMKKTLGNKFSLVPLASHLYDKDQLFETNGEPVLKAWEIGCTANYNAYTESQNEIVNFEDGVRTGSCHIHVGNRKLCDFHMRHKAIRLLDIFVGCASVIFDKDIDASRRRRKYYGASGEFRPTDYGLEYRVLSPFVLRSPKLVELVYDLVDFTMAIIQSDKVDEILGLVNPESVHKAINECDINLSRDILKTVKLPIRLFKRVEADYDVADFDKNWNI
jgi:hypothetical protein